MARGLHIDVTIADHPGVMRRGAGFGSQGVDADAVRFLMFEAVAAVDPEHQAGEPEVLHDGIADTHRFVGQDGESVSCPVQAVEHRRALLGTALYSRRRGACNGPEEFEGLANFLIAGFGPHRAFDQNRRAVPA